MYCHILFYFLWTFLSEINLDDDDDDDDDEKWCLKLKTRIATDQKLPMWNCFTYRFVLEKKR